MTLAHDGDVNGQVDGGRDGVNGDGGTVPTPGEPRRTAGRPSTRNALIHSSKHSQSTLPPPNCSHLHHPPLHIFLGNICMYIHLYAMLV